MTITYTAEVATTKKFGNFLKLLWRWKGSIYKLVWRDLLVFLLLFFTISIVYRNFLGPDGRRNFEGLVNYCSSYGSLIPMSFVLGFFVSFVMKRWWDQYITIPWPDSTAVYVSSHFHGQDERGRVMRRTVMRYVCVCLTITFTLISPRVKKRFPSYDHLVEAGLLLENEKEVIENMDKVFPQHPKHWMPIVWAASIITRARKEGRIRDDFAVKTIIDELNAFRGQCGFLMIYDWINVPLVYTQVVTLAVYSYFLCTLMAQQWVQPEGENKEKIIDYYFPFYTILQFFFYMGWLKVAETLINPFGEDDDDFEVNWMIDRNLQVSYLIVDEMHHEHPELVRDQYWDEVFPNELPYADADAKREEAPEPSTAKTDMSQNNLASVRVDGSGRSDSRKPSNNSDTFTDSELSDGGLTLKKTKKKLDLRPLLSDQKELVKKGEGVENNDDDDDDEEEEEEELSEQSYVELINKVDSDESEDHFERLRAQRERVRTERQRSRFLRNMEAITRDSNDIEPIATSTPLSSETLSVDDQLKKEQVEKEPKQKDNKDRDSNI